MDPEGRVVELNEAGREILKLAREARGERFGRVLADAPDFRALVEQVLSRARRSPGAARCAGSASTRPERVLGVTATPAEGADGRFLGAVALFSDLTEIRELEGRVALARHLADLGQVSAGAAHEFRNAAAAIDGFADLALRSTDPERAAEYVRAIRQEAQEMSRVTSDFLLFARPEGFVPEPVDLDGRGRGRRAASSSAPIPGVAVARSGEFPEVPGSAVLLRRALVEPAAQRRRGDARGPARRARTRSRSRAAAGARRDHAVGRGPRRRASTPAAREKIFLPFYSSKPRGLGLRPADRGAHRGAARRDGRGRRTGRAAERCLR